ncbi:hypothetical protein SODALDRAFT_363364 [Sodiomyces alkalinus F11]|uniref:Btz domain-containing protein n=1 Tax=Sodiomyces alkalinus (strain CBS 110278 / VKM F-3762 / F11) TaxID=1314773 RepID=A0A3N2PLW0_SODAK|nr:hypothetical protein SODALDRAFT_363364 [Sodiomyces alkalinus F11]ROT35525.1 hypothetical protein SODALDRAFT_363364 [Sodiomyces alkalinus F11]
MYPKADRTRTVENIGLKSSSSRFHHHPTSYLHPGQSCGFPQTPQKNNESSSSPILIFPLGNLHSSRAHYLVILRAAAMQRDPTTEERPPPPDKRPTTKRLLASWTVARRSLYLCRRAAVVAFVSSFDDTRGRSLYRLVTTDSQLLPLFPSSVSASTFDFVSCLRRRLITSMSASRRSKMLGRRRRVEDEAEEEGPHDHLELDDDSFSEGSAPSDDRDHHADSDTSIIDEKSPVTPDASKPKPTANGAEKVAQPDTRVPSDTQLMTHGIPIADKVDGDGLESHVEDAAVSKPSSVPAPQDAPAPPLVPNGPLVVSSNSAPKQPAEPVGERRRREHEEYRRRRDEDPAFVPNRGAFFMHDHRHAGPAANGFRPFGRGRGRGRGGGAIGGPFAPINQFQGPSDPLTSNQWAHDMHDVVANPAPPRYSGRNVAQDEGPPNGSGIIPTCPPNSTPINRTMSTEKHLGNVQVKVYLPFSKQNPTAFSMPFKQYTKLPDHRPPLRRDKPVRISLPDNPPRYIFPAIDRSFIFIPRAMRPNQQRARAKPRPGLGSVGGYSRRPSVLGGSFYGSTYSPSIALSRRSSLAHDGRDYVFSPTGSAISRPPIPPEGNRPVVRLPPAAPQPQPQPQLQPQLQPQMYGGPDMAAASGPTALLAEASISDLPPPQTHPLPQKPTFHENRRPLPMHQPRPQKTVSVADIELNQPPFQQAFHQQVPVQVSNGLGQESHSRQPSYQSQQSAGTPLPHIPERAIHAPPFQPNAYPPQGYYGPQQYPIPQPQPQPQQQQGYYYPHHTYPGAAMAPSAAPAPFNPPSQPGQGRVYGQPHTLDAQAGQQPGQAGQMGVAPNMVAQEVNGMVYYYDASQMPPPMDAYPGFQAPQTYGTGVPGMGGVVTPSPDGFFYPPAPIVYYPQ